MYVRDTLGEIDNVHHRFEQYSDGYLRIWWKLWYFGRFLKDCFKLKGRDFRIERYQIFKCESTQPYAQLISLFPPYRGFGVLIKPALFSQMSWGLTSFLSSSFAKSIFWVRTSSLTTFLECELCQSVRPVNLTSTKIPILLITSTSWLSFYLRKEWFNGPNWSLGFYHFFKTILS